MVLRCKFRDQGAPSDLWKRGRVQHQHDGVLGGIPMTRNNRCVVRQVDDPRTIAMGDAMQNVSPIQQQTFQPISTGSAVPALLAAGPSWPSLAVNAGIAPLEPAAIGLRHGFMRDVHRLVDQYFHAPIVTQTAGTNWRDRASPSSHVVASG